MLCLQIMQDDDDSSSSQRRRSQLPPLAPRHSQSSSNARPSGSSSGRPPRLSHRSRAGCWTCRARKVKCDEIHPKCGPCARLNRECDWDHRWNFSDATTSTLIKHANVKTSGNAVWDPKAGTSPSVSPVTRQQDDLPPFNVLTTDDERERKAETQRPGTFGVVVTPESFSDLPEYATASFQDGRRMSIQSHTSSFSSQTPPLGQVLTRVRTDANVVVLDRFEDVSPISTTSLPASGRRPSVPDGMQYLSITSPSSEHIVRTSPTFPPILKGGDSSITHFRHYIVRRLVQPQIEGAPTDMISPGSTKDIFEIESARSEPLYHAICAVSALNLAYNGGSTLEQAMQHYHQALSTETSAANPEDLLADGVFLRHFLLFIYDICIPISDGSEGTDMWTIHLNHLQRIATLRHQTFGQESHAYLLWCICELDMYACLLGSGYCDFVQTVLQQNMLPSLEHQVPLVVPSSSGTYLANETSTFPDILALNQAMVMQTAKMAQIAQTFRNEAVMQSSVSPGSAARWQANVSQLQSELSHLWTHAYPHYLDSDDLKAGEKLPSRVRYVFEHALTLYHATMIYSRTSMFPGQRRIPVANQNSLYADTERRILSIISIATTQLADGHLDRRHVIFPLFIAGFATSQPDVKIQALDIIKSYEGSGIGQNTYRTRQLLIAVYEEQRLKAEAGGRMEDVDWLVVARERSLMVVNCGL